MKRTIDIVLSTLALVILAPLLALIALAVKVDSPGPALYSQVRVGRRGRQFRMHKFRSMVALADQIGPPLTGGDDPRIMRVGRWLRRLRLDELPQLLNVVKGDMSLVGPRPEVPAIVDRYTDEQRTVLDVRPGMTGPTQLAWLGESELYPSGADPVDHYVRYFLKLKLDCDLEYIRTRSLAGDFGYLIRTPLVLVSRAASSRLQLGAIWPKLGRLAVDAMAVGVAHLAAFWGRFEWPIPATEVPYLLWGLPLTCGVYLLAFIGLRTYRSIWRFASIGDALRVAQAVALGASLQAVALVLLGWRPYPRSVVVSTAVLSVMFLGAVRLLARSRVVGKTASSSRCRVVILGAGKTGESIAREICESGLGDYELIGFVDDDPAKWGETIRRYPVLGAVDELPGLARVHQIEEVIVAIPSLGGRQLRRIAELCLAAGVRFKSLPSLAQLVRGEGKLRYLRKIDVDEFLSREPLAIDEAGIRAFLRGKRVMVTGAGGSIGSELCRQVLRLGAGSLVMVERAENALHDVSLEVQREFPGVPVTAALADVKHVPRMTEMFRRCRPEIVFHAAAYKHVPILEDHPGEAVLNNVVGTKRIAEVARRWGTETFVLISTDKAVHPKNLLGVTKRLCEMYVTALNEAARRESRRSPRTRFVMVRFGNVLGSAGSVLPLFQRQIENGHPVTITDPEVSRFFMTIPEAVGLVLQSISLKSDGHLFVLDMGKPVKISELADGLVAALGLAPSDVERQYVGLRPGEKLEEALWEPDERVSRSDHPRIFVARPPVRPLDEVEALVIDLEAMAIRGDIVALLQRLGEVFPAYRPHRVETPFAVSEAGEQYRILVVDDDPTMCALVRDILGDAYEVAEAHSAGEALTRINADRPHLVLLDVVLPDDSGLALCRSLRADPTHHGVPVIFMTGFGDPDTVVTALEAGGDDYLTKPCRVEELRARVEAVLRRSHGAAPLVGARGVPAPRGSRS